MRNFCNRNYNAFELETWPLNRKALPLYRRIGFKAVPGTCITMRNYIPMLIRHPKCRYFFAENDYFRTLSTKRGSCYEDVKEAEKLGLFRYVWKSRDCNLTVEVDWRRDDVASVSRRE